MIPREVVTPQDESQPRPPGISDGGSTCTPASEVRRDRLVAFACVHIGLWPASCCTSSRRSDACTAGAAESGMGDHLKHPLDIPAVELPLGHAIGNKWARPTLY